MGAAALPIALGASAAGGGVSALGTLQAGKASSSYYNYLAGISGINANLAKAEGQANVQAIGAQSFSREQALTRNVNETIGAQRAGSVSGAGSGSRTAQDIIKDTISKGERDEEALRMNEDMQTKSAVTGAAIQAFNYQTQGFGYSMAGKNALQASQIGAASTLLTSAGQVANLELMGSIKGSPYGWQPGALNPSTVNQ